MSSASRLFVNCGLQLSYPSIKYIICSVFVEWKKAAVIIVINTSNNNDNDLIYSQRDGV